uniref:Syntrophin, gamma 2 n=1 Tax=Petromyzon marinus TaxID=7757 RepID=S4R7U8_PETMA
VHFQTKSGVVLLHDGKTGSHEVRLKLSKDVLTVQKQDVVCVGGSSVSNERTVTLCRQRVGGFGLSIKGGAEHNVPVVISKIFKDQAADQTGMLFVGDAILQVNGINVVSCTHEELVRILRNAGDEVTLTVGYLKEAPAFLKLPSSEESNCSPIPSSDHSSGTSSPLFDSGLHLNGGSSNSRVIACSSSPVSSRTRWEKQWCDTLSLPLLMARVSSYTPGTDQLRPNAFEVIAVDGISSGVLQCHSMQECYDWYQAISSNTTELTQQNMKMSNKYSPAHDQIVHMGWLYERAPTPDTWQVYRTRFLALKGHHMHLFSCPPVSTRDWEKAERIYNVFEVLCKVLKGGDLQDQKEHCFRVMTSTEDIHYFSVEQASELAVWEKAFQTASFLEVQRRWVGGLYPRGHCAVCLIDQDQGFISVVVKTKHLIWHYKFAQLKGSSDDGMSRVKFLFQNTDTKLVETKELEFANHMAVLHCIHSFVAAKVALVDPAFVEAQGASKKHALS